MMFSVCIAATRSTTVEAAITSICCQTWPDWELIIVAQGQDARLHQICKAATQADQRVRVLYLEQYGLSLARNAGLQAATGELIAMLDDDCEAHPDWLKVLAEDFEANSEVMLIGGSLVAPRRARRGFAICPSFKPKEELYDPITSGRKAPPGWNWIGGNFAFRRSIIECVGPFDEYLGAGAVFPAAEDTDYKLRLEAIGMKMRSTPHAIVYHTYGYRYGLRAVLRNSRNYARGNAGLAGKLTLLGDSRGQEWLAETRRSCIKDWIRPFRPQRIPANLLRLWHYTSAYYRCLREFRVEPVHGLLCPIRK